MSIPVEVEQDQNLYNLNTKLTNLRSEFITNVSTIFTGTQSTKRVMGDLMERINETLDELATGVETIVIPKDSATDFTNGDTTLDEYASFDMLEYYKGIKKLKLIFKTVTSALFTLQQYKEKPLNPVPLNSSSSGVLQTLREEEFLEQGFDNPVKEVRPQYKYYTILSTDTLQDIASKMYSGDFTRWTEIADANNLKESDLLDNDLTGVTIKIPVQSSSRTDRDTSNLVFEKEFSGTDQLKFNKYVYGADIDLYEGQFIVDARLDIRIMSGMKTVLSNILDRLSNRQGSLNPIHVNWGIPPLSRNGKIPYLIWLDKMLGNIENQAVADPRVISANIVRSSVRIDKDALYVDLTTKLVGGSTEKHPIEVPIL